MREDFSGLRLPDEFLELYPPNSDALFTLVRFRTTDEMLARISESDYGMAAAEHFVALERIRSGIDSPRGWLPNEVLQLFRWSEYTSERRLLDPQQFHLARPFCCCAFLRPSGVDRNDFDTDTLGRLIESCLILGEPFRRPLMGLITWSIEGMEPWDQAYLFYAFGLLVVLAHEEDVATDSVARLAEWLMRANAEILPWHVSPTVPPQRVVDVRFSSIRPEFRRRLKESVGRGLPAESEVRQFCDWICDYVPSAAHAVPETLGERILNFLRRLRKPSGIDGNGAD